MNSLCSSRALRLGGATEGILYARHFAGISRMRPTYREGPFERFNRSVGLQKSRRPGPVPARAVSIGAPPQPPGGGWRVSRAIWPGGASPLRAARDTARLRGQRSRYGPARCATERVKANQTHQAGELYTFPIPARRAAAAAASVCLEFAAGTTSCRGAESLGRGRGICRGMRQQISHEQPPFNNTTVRKQG